MSQWQWSGWMCDLTLSLSINIFSPNNFHSSVPSCLYVQCQRSECPCSVRPKLVHTASHVCALLVPSDNGTGCCLSCRGSAVRNNPAGVKACGERGCWPTSAATQPGAIFLTPRKSTRKSPRHGAVWNVISLCDLDSGRIWKSIHCNAHNSDRALVAI